VPGRFKTKVAARDIRRGEMPRVDAGALDDPLVGGFDASRRQILGEIVIGHAAWGQIAAGAGNA
jgi:hypothetical protein